MDVGSAQPLPAARARPSSAPGTIEAPCPLCGTPDGRPFHVESGWQLRRCGECTFVFVSPRPDGPALREHYRDYLPEASDEIAAWERMMRGVHRDVVRQAHRLVPEGRALDVGCGFGFLVRELLAAGYDAMGLDISATPLEYARETLALPVRHGTLEELQLPARSFDLITALYVVEHVPDPLTFLEEIHRLLRPGGVVLLRWPHTTPIVSLLRPFGIDLGLYDLPSHLSDFRPRTMHRALHRVGFRGIATRVGGWTRPPERWKAVSSLLTGVAAEGLAAITGGLFLLPGVSKTTVAVRA